MEALFVALFSFQNSYYFIATFCESDTDSLIFQRWANKDTLFLSFVYMGKADTPDKYCTVSHDSQKRANQDALSRKLFVGIISQKWTKHLHLACGKSRGYKLLSHSNHELEFIRTNKLILSKIYLYLYCFGNHVFAACLQGK